MNTQQGRHAMVDGKRVAHGDCEEGEQFLFHCERFFQAPCPCGRNPEHSMARVDALPERDDWYVVEEEEKPKFRECAIAVRGEGDYALTCFQGKIAGAYMWETLTAGLGPPDFAGILMPDGLNVVGLFEDIDGVPYQNCLLSELKSGHVKPVDLTKCKVLLGESQ